MGNQSNRPGPSCMALSNHDGEEVRLIHVVRQGTGLPLLFRHVAGSVIDVSTVTAPIAEPEAMGRTPGSRPSTRVTTATPTPRRPWTPGCR